MENLLAGIPGIAIYLDDIVVSGQDEQTHDKRLEEVLRRMSQAGLRLKRTKCQFASTQVVFLGYIVSADGIRPTGEKTQAIKEAHPPRNKTELKAFLGLVNFYNVFLKDKATIAEPLHKLLRADSPWHFGMKELEAFNKLKELISSDTVLTHYCLDKELVMSCDASSYGLGAVLSHVDENGHERPIAFASRTLSDTERRYAQVDREGLAVIFGVQKFHNYIAGRKVTIYTDHKPLATLFDPKKQIAQVISPRMLRWCLLLSNYTYEIRYRPGKALADADGCSRLPLETTVVDLPNPAEVLLLESKCTPVSADEIRECTRSDPTLQKLKRLVLGDLPYSQGKDDPLLSPYLGKLNDISLQGDCLLWGNRVIIPTVLREKMLQELHAVHPGIVQMKMIARGYVWWYRIDRDIEDFVNKCPICQGEQALPPKEKPSSWIPTDRPWCRVHVDLFGPLKGQVFLLVVDSHSKWVEIEPLSSQTSESAIRKLRRIFATHGIPEVLVSDNGSIFTSQEFDTFLQNNRIHHITTPIAHPSSNGQVERFIQSAKQALAKLTEGDWHVKLARYLIHQHSMPSPTTGKSPAELMFGRKLRTVLAATLPTSQSSLSEDRETHKTPTRSFNIGDAVLTAVWRNKKTFWVPGTVKARLGDYVYIVRLDDGTEGRRHVDHLRRNQNRNRADTSNP